MKFLLTGLFVFGVSAVAEEIQDLVVVDEAVTPIHAAAAAAVGVNSTNVVTPNTVISNTHTNVVTSNTVISNTHTNVVTSNTVISNTHTNVVTSNTVISNTHTAIITPNTVINGDGEFTDDFLKPETELPEPVIAAPVQ